jgi:hypothetical protein
MNRRLYSCRRRFRQVAIIAMPAMATPAETTHADNPFNTDCILPSCGAARPCLAAA